MNVMPKNSEKLSDEELVQKAQKNIDFFGILVERYEKRLLFYIQRISAFSLEESEEILQEVFIKAWQNIKGFDADLKFSSWIYRITHNQTISAFRKHKSHKMDQQVELDESLFIADKTDFVQELDANISAKSISQTLQKMPEKYRDILILKFLEEKSYEEISDILQKPSGTIATLIHRAKESFKATAQKNNTSFS